MKKILLIVALCLPLVALGGNKKKTKKANTETTQWRYEIENVTAGSQGTIVIKVWSHSKSPTVATEQAKKNAVHGVIFKGVPGKDRTPAKKALVESSAAESQHADFFKTLFSDGGEYMRFVAVTNSGSLGANDVLKTDKKEYKVGVTVTVHYNDLRKYLEDKGVVKKLGAGF